MTWIQSLLLGLIQGISEFLPVSSSGHLNLAQHLLNAKPSLALDIVLNTATLLSVLIFFRRRISFFKENIKYILIGSIPAAIIGIFLKDSIKIVFENVGLLPFFFLITAIFLLSTKFAKNTGQLLNYNKALTIGLFQALAILPGVSRAGSTIFIALLLGISPKTAFDFSFSLFIPASIGAIFVGIKDITLINLRPDIIIFSFVTAFLSGLIALALLRKVLLTGKFWLFGFYVLIIAVTAFFII